MSGLWLRGLLSRCSWQLLGAIAGVTLMVALLVALGSFVASSSAAMTQRAIASVPVDWQVQQVPGTEPQPVIGALKKATPVTALDTVGYADTSGFRATTGGTTQITGPGKVLGVPTHYRRNFPGQIRTLIGRSSGVLAAQQTAANLHVKLGDTVTIQRVGVPPVKVQIAGVVSLPNRTRCSRRWVCPLAPPRRHRPTTCC